MTANDRYQGANERLDALTADRCDVNALLECINIAKLLAVPVSPEYATGKRIRGMLTAALDELECERDRLNDSIERVGPLAEAETAQQMAEESAAYMEAVR